MRSRAPAAFQPRSQRGDNGSLRVEGARRTSGLGCAQDRALPRTGGGEPARAVDGARDPAAAWPRGCAGRRAAGLAALREACADEQGVTVQNHLQTTFRRYGLPEALFVDNGGPWGDASQTRWTRL